MSDHPSSRIAWFALPVVVLAWSLAGCGSSADDDDARAVAEDYIAALVSFDGEETCARLTSEAQATYENGCASKIDRLGEVAPADFSAVEVDQVTVDGETATVTLQNAPGVFEMVKVEEAWLVSDPLP